MRLAARDPEASTGGTELARTVAEIKADIAQVSALPIGGVTPIIFSIQPAESIDHLLATNLTVGFDLRGYGTAERWPWVTPKTGLLVWDPLGEGKITSARQLFGSYTFEIFRADGYAAMAALDDNRNGLLQGVELDGIRAWFDSNSDGRAEPNEVHDLSELGIVALDVHAVTMEGPHPSNPVGLRLIGGETRPTWDWTVDPLPTRQSIMQNHQALAGVP